ncbi:MAG: dihydroneopterin aldolase [Firmicutes bacterium ZCTH02-B6]|nr:MAG: dihydroneopterin aldolase [Firmicutes bacterium ZCTH02-B6]
MADRISLRNMVFYAYHGAYAVEHELGRRFEVDVDLFTDLRPAGSADELALTINYAEVYAIVKEIVEGGPHKLLETVAETVAARLLAALPAARVTVRVRKPHAPVGGPVDYAEIEITRPA